MEVRYGMVHKCLLSVSFFSLSSPCSLIRSDLFRRVTVNCFIVSRRPREREWRRGTVGSAGGGGIGKSVANAIYMVIWNRIDAQQAVDPVTFVVRKAETIPFVLNLRICGSNESRRGRGIAAIFTSDVIGGRGDRSMFLLVCDLIWKFHEIINKWIIIDKYKSLVNNKYNN